ncbi:MAG: hypothetical protein MR890_02785 [Akkermansia muciniphila]|nr:hypothetical protein [Akkermansia muciniphila]
MANSRKKSVRLLAWQLLQQWAEGGVFAETLVARTAQREQLSRPDRALLQLLVYDTLRNMSLLDYRCRQLRSGKLEASLRWLVLVGLCQVLIQQGADHASVNETVAAAPMRARGLVNGILRNAVRRRDEFAAELPKLPPAIRFSAPDWLVDRWVDAFGAQEAEALLATLVQTPSLFARVNALNPPKEIPADWEPLPGMDDWYRVPALPQEELRAGQVYMADPATRYSVQMLAPVPGERVLDACAAPGGKSAAILAATQGKVHLLATDADAHRLPMLKANLALLGVEGGEVAEHDWTQPCPQKRVGAFDAVLLDVPCSNTGVLQRRVDARWRLTPQEITRLAGVQRRILEEGAKAVAPGGRLVYSTCSIDAEENGAVVRAFAEAHPEFEIREEHTALPHREFGDGSYAVLLVRA